MKNQIKENLQNNVELEKLYQKNKVKFKKAFFEIYPEIADYKIADFWKTRLEFEEEKQNLIFNKKDILPLIVSFLIAGFLIQIPKIFCLDLTHFLFYEKNVGLIVFFGLSIYIFLIRETLKRKKLIISMAIFFISALYINILPNTLNSDSINLAFVHLPLMIWSLYGLIFINFNLTDKIKRMDYIKYNGDLAILSAIIIISGGILTAITIGLFATIGLNIEEFYFNYIVITGLVSVPTVATFIIKRYSFVTNKIAPIIANIFSPLVLITLIIYLVSILMMGKNLYHDRDFLFIFNLMLIGVMAIIIFSVSETSIHLKHRFNEWVLLLLSMVTLIIDVAAISAIMYRVIEFGITPNRLAVLGSNGLIFGNLILIMIDLYKVIFKKVDIHFVELRTAKYLPIYTFWTVFVVFCFPLLFECN